MDCPPGVVRRAARQPSSTSGVTHNVRLPRRRRPASYSAQLFTRNFILGMWRRRGELCLFGMEGAAFQYSVPEYPIFTLSMQQGLFVVVSIVVFIVLPFLTPRFFKKYGGRVSELEAKYLLFFLFAMGGLALWAGSEPVLPAYMIGMVLAGTVGKDHSLIRRLRTLTFGLLTPF